jgi:hypothetical protein
MKVHPRIAIALVVGAGVVSSCDPHSTFVRRIADADRVVVRRPENGALTIVATLKGENVRELVSSVKSAERCGDVAPDAYALDAEFLRGTNVLGKILYSDGYLWVPSEGNLEYRDDTHALRLYQMRAKRL